MGSSVLVQSYEAEKADLESKMQAINSLAMARDDKHYTQSEAEQLRTLHDRMNGLHQSIQLAALTDELAEQTTTAIARGIERAHTENHVYTSEGEALWDVWNRDRDDGARMRLDRAAQHMGTKAANTIPTAGGFDALVVQPVAGPVIRLYPTDTPFLTLVGAQPLPSGLPFTRPRIVDPNVLTAAGPHAGTAPALEKGELPSVKWDYKSELVTPTVIGNYINVSYEAISWVPSALQAVIDQLRLRTELGIESRLVTFAGQTTSHVTLDPAADSAATVKAVWDAMAVVTQATGSPATWMAAGPLGTAMLGAKVDLAGRPLFPQMGPTNAPGSSDAFTLISPFGLRFAQVPAITDTTIFVGNSIGLEAYVYRFPVLEAIEPSVLGRQVAASAAVGFYSPVTTEPSTHGAVCKVGP